MYGVFICMTEQSKYQLSDIFICTMCGYCCQGETTVSLDDDDRKRMVEKLEMTRDEVKEKYWRVTGSIIQMKIVDGHCIFYDEKSGCSVHEGRPWRCGQWPLHPSILFDKNNFETIRESCPGINREISYEKFCQILSSLLASREKMIC